MIDLGKMTVSLDTSLLIAEIQSLSGFVDVLASEILAHSESEGGSDKILPILEWTISGDKRVPSLSSEFAGILDAACRKHIVNRLEFSVRLDEFGRQEIANIG